MWRQDDIHVLTNWGVRTLKNHPWGARRPPVAVVGRRPDGEHRLVEVPLVALHDQLVGAADHVDVVGGVELGHHIAAEQVAGPPRTHAPACGVWGGETQKDTFNTNSPITPGPCTGPGGGGGLLHH